MRWMLFILFLAGNAAACEKGCFKYRGECTCDIQPEAAEPVKPSDEKPPQSGMPSYQAPGVVIFMPESLAAQDMKADQEKAQAEAQGRKAAGLK